MADIAEVRDWRRVGGPRAGETGPVPVPRLIRRVKSATSWKPWPINRKTVIDDQLDGWGFLTRRKTELAVYDDQVLPHSPFSGWVAFAIEPEDVEAGQVVADDLEAQVRAASLPPGQIRALGNIGERLQTGGSRHQRGTGLEGR